VKFSLKKLTVAVALGGVCSPTLVMAQDSGLIEEVVVTATKRTATLQDIPVAVSVTTGETIEQAQILDINDLQSDRAFSRCFYRRRVSVPLSWCYFRSSKSGAG